LAEYEKNKVQKNNPDKLSSRSGSNPRGDNPYDQQGDKMSTMVRFDQKTVIYLAGLSFALLNGYLVHRFSTEFDTRFKKSIELYEYRLKYLEREHSEIKKDVTGIMVKIGGSK